VRPPSARRASRGRPATAAPAARPGRATAPAAAEGPAAPGPSAPATFRKLSAAGVGPSFRDVAAVVTAEARAPGPGEVMVRVAYAGVNGGCETFRARGDHAFGFLRGRGAFDLGAEGCGTVEAVGEGVGGLAVGDAVTFVGGAFAEVAYPKAAACRRVDRCSAEAVALCLSGVTAAVGVEATGRCAPGMSVLVTAAAGGTGHFAAQLAARAGARVFATCGTRAKAARLRAVGVHRPIVHTEESVAAVLRAECPRGLDLAYEGVGGEMLSAAVEHLAPGGLVMVVGYISGYPHARQSDAGAGRGPGGPAPADGPRARAPGWDLPPEEEIFWGRLEVAGPGGRRVVGDVYRCTPEERAACRERVFELHARGELEAWVDPEPFVGIERVPDAVDWMLSGRSTGKVVARIGGGP